MMDYDKAIDAVARWSLHSAYERWVEEGWESLPDIGELDYERVVRRMKALLPTDVTAETHNEAYDVLTERAAGTPA